MRGNIHRRIEDLEERIPRPQEQRPLIRPELKEFLDRYAHRKVTGTLTPEDEAIAARLRAEIKRREARGEISRRGGGER